MKLRTYLIATVACAAAASWVVPAYADDFPQPGDVVNKSNMAQAQDVLSPTANWMINQGMNMHVGAYREYEWPRLYAEATEKYAGQVQITEDGRQIFNYVAGCPFPNIDSNDPLGGAKVMWNHEYFSGFHR